MNKDLIFDFLEIKYEVFGYSLHRIRLIRIFRTMEGINPFGKHPLIFEIMKKDTMYFYLGFGSMGDLFGIYFKEINKIGITENEIKMKLNKDDIKYTIENNKYILENNITLYFDENYYLCELLTTDYDVATNKLKNLTGNEKHGLLTVEMFGVPPLDESNWSDGVYKSNNE